MKAKDNLKPSRVVDPAIEKLALTKKKRGLIYKFSKKTGRNRGPLLPSEKRDRSAYDYSDEM